MACSICGRNRESKLYFRRNPEGKRPLERPRHRRTLREIIEMDVKKWDESGLDSSGSG
jgi:hypothetical protein